MKLSQHDELLLHRHLDGELDAASSASFRARLAAEPGLAKAAEAATQLDTARAEAKSKPDPAAVKEAAKAAEKRKADVAKASNDAKLAVEPVSIYISRATQKLYVRRNTHKPAPDGGGATGAWSGRAAHRAD